MRAVAVGASVAACVLLLAPRARGHPAPAEAPEFEPGDCIVTLDPSVQSTLALPYRVAYDDRELMSGDIALPDAKTHQFFAFSGALFAHGFGYALQPFAPADAAPIELPLWITADDVKRAAQASGSADGTTFSEADVPQDAVLDQHPQLAGSFLRITPDAARLPITVAQSERGETWDVSDVAPGIYTIATYIFSPPYNGWAVRPGLVRITPPAQTAETAEPAMVIESVHAVVFGYQGRRVRACVRAPAGLLLHAFYRSEDTDEGWLPWRTEPLADGGNVELCFRSPRPELSGSLRLRFDLEAEDGTTHSFYSPDTLTALAGSGECTPSDTICCDAPAPAVTCASGGAAACTQDAAVPIDDAAVDADAARDAAVAGAPERAPGGCAIAARGGRAALPVAGIALLLVALGRRRTGLY